MNDMIVKKGEVVNFTMGEYSDFSNVGTLVFIKDVNLSEVAQDLCIDKEPYEVALDEIVSHLCAMGVAMVAEVEEVWLGSYCEFASQFKVTYKYD